MAYTYDPIFAADPSNAQNVAANAAIIIFDPADTGKAPIALTDVSGSPLPNPITVNRNGFGPAFTSTLDRVGWFGGGFTGFFTSYEGIKAAAVAAQTAAVNAAANAGAAATADVASRVAAGEFKGDKGADGSNVLPTDVAIKDAINNAASATRGALKSSFMPKWQPNTAYVANDKVLSPNGEVLSSKLNFTSGATYDPANWDKPLDAAYALKGEGVAIPSDTFVSNGDSLTFSAGTDWPTLVGTDLGITATNRGMSGWSSTDIAVRQGAVQPGLTVTGNTIPASGAVTVTAVTPGSYRSDSTGTISWTGTLAGIYGTLVHNGTAGTWVFTRSAAGSATACPPATPFIDSSGDAYRSAIQSFFVGRNNFNPGTDPLDVVKDTDLMVRRLLTDRYLVLGMTTSGSEIAGTTNYKTIVKVAGWLAARHGSKFIDIRRELIDNAMKVMGLTYTNQDKTDVANDIIPTTLKIDTLHFTAAGYEFIGKVVAQRIRDLGYVPGKLPVVAPVAVTGLTVGTATSSTQALSWTAAPDATAYAVNYRLAGGSTWTTGVGTTTTTATVPGLNAGTSYDYQVIAYNIDGASPAVTTTASTIGSPPVMLTSDSFNRADTAAGVLGTTDIAYGGTAMAWTSDAQLQILSNQVGATALSSNRHARVDTGSNDHRVEIKLAVVGNGQGPMVRRVDASNYYSIVVDSTTGGTGSVTRRAAGVSTTIGNAGAFAAGDTVGLSAVGSTITAYKNGVQVYQVTDTGVPAGTFAGFQSAFNMPSFRIDDFKAWDK